MSETVAEIQDFIGTALGTTVAPDDDFFDMGLVNSLFALELVVFVEERFRIRVEVEDLDLASFRTASRIAAFVKRKTAAPSTAGHVTGSGA